MSNILTHHGVLGMKWGVRRTPEQLGYSKREIKKDAKKYAKAKAAYGEGAGIKRRQVNAELAKKLKDTNYKKDFDKVLESLNAKSINRQAKINRTAKDAANQTKRSAKFVLRALTGSTTIAAAAMLYAQNKEKVDATVLNILQKIKR